MRYPTSAPDLVVFLDADWGSSYLKNRQHFLISELARQLEGRSSILAVERPVCPWTGPFRARKVLVQKLLGKRGVRRIGPNLFLYTPVAFLHNVAAARLPGLTALNRRLLRAELLRVLRKLDFPTDRLVAWIHHPYQWEDVGLLGEQFLVYDCYDDYLAAALSVEGKKDLERRQVAILRRADCVLAVSTVLVDALDSLRVRARQGNVHLVPNGVQFEHFAAADNGGKLGHSGPVLGYTGIITRSRLDLSLLAKVAAMHPEWSFEFIGPIGNEHLLSIDADYRRLLAAPNVLFAGPVPYRELPFHMRHFDACLLPYTAADPFNTSSCPLKLYEYMATGKPIVSTDLPAVRPFEGVVRIARDVEGFERQVLDAMEDRNEERRRQRQALARDNSWERRAEAVLAALNADGIVLNS